MGVVCLMGGDWVSSFSAIGSRDSSCPNPS